MPKSRLINDGFESCSDTIVSPLGNQDTLAHEYAHQIFYSTYDAKNSDYPNYTIREHDGEYIHSPVHASPAGTTWIEGWAFFMATAFDNDPVYQPSYMAGKWNFETRTNTETTDPRFVGKSFVDGYEGEGNIAAALYDALDATNENSLDDKSNLILDIWNTLRDNLESEETVIAANFTEFKNDWDDSGRPNLDNIFSLNTLPLDTVDPPSPPPSNTINSFSDSFEEHDYDISDKWILSDTGAKFEIDQPEENNGDRQNDLSGDYKVAHFEACINTCSITMIDSVYETWA